MRESEQFLESEHFPEENEPWKGQICFEIAFKTLPGLVGNRLSTQTIQNTTTKDQVKIATFMAKEPKSPQTAEQVKFEYILNCILPELAKKQKIAIKFK